MAAGCLRSGRSACLVVRAEKEATLDLDDSVEGGADYSGILAGALLHGRLWLLFHTHPLSPATLAPCTHACIKCASYKPLRVSVTHAGPSRGMSSPDRDRAGHWA